MKLIAKILLVFLILLIGARIALPHVLLRCAEYRLNKIPEYRVKIRDLDVHLYRGSYTIKDISMVKLNKNIPVPFFTAKTIDLSIQWKALFSGRLVAKIIVDAPTINVVLDPRNNNEQLTIDKQWQTAVRSLFPLNINFVQIENGKLALRSFTATPPFNLYLQHIQLFIENMQSVRHDQKQQMLPSYFHGAAEGMEGSSLSLNGHFDPFSKKPTFKLEGALKSMQINSANNFLRHYTLADVKQGQFSLYVEMAALNGQVKGYAKPIVKDLKVLNPQKKMDPIEFLYKGALDVIAKVLTNSDKKTLATKVKIEGSLDDPDTSILSIIGYTLRHAFIQALLPQIDHDITMRDVILSKTKSTYSYNKK